MPGDGSLEDAVAFVYGNKCLRSQHVAVVCIGRWDAPIEKMFKAIQIDYKFNVKHIRTWGCVAYVRKPDNQRVRSAKMSPKADKGFLVGMEGPNGHIYKVYLPDQGKVVRAQDFKFNEQKLGKDEDDTEVEYEAVLVDPDIHENGVRIILEAPVREQVQTATSTLQGPGEEAQQERVADEDTESFEADEDDKLQQQLTTEAEKHARLQTPEQSPLRAAWDDDEDNYDLADEGQHQDVNGHPLQKKG